MPHKRAKRSIREKLKVERKSDLAPAPSETTYTANDIPKSVARVLNAEAVQKAWKEKKKRALEGEPGQNDKRKKRKVDNGCMKPEIKIKPGESLKHFKRRVEEDMRPLIRSAMKNTVSISKQKLKQSQKESEQFDVALRRKGDSDYSDEKTYSDLKGRKNKNERSQSPDFTRVSSSAPKRLNDVVKAPPELKVAPRLDRLAQKARKRKSQSECEEVGDDEGSADRIVSLQHKRMMELEREKAINQYRALKEAKLKKQGAVPV